MGKLHQVYNSQFTHRDFLAWSRCEFQETRGLSHCFSMTSPLRTCRSSRGKQGFLPLQVSLERSWIWYLMAAFEMPTETKQSFKNKTSFPTYLVPVNKNLFFKTRYCFQPHVFFWQLTRCSDVVCFILLSASCRELLVTTWLQNSALLTGFHGTERQMGFMSCNIQHCSTQYCNTWFLGIVLSAMHSLQ